MARLLVGEDQRFFAPASMAAGAMLLAGAHAVSITIVPGLGSVVSFFAAIFYATSIKQENGLLRR